MRFVNTELIAQISYKSYTYRNSSTQYLTALRFRKKIIATFIYFPLVSLKIERINTLLKRLG